MDEDEAKVQLGNIKQEEAPSFLTEYRDKFGTLLDLNDTVKSKIKARLHEEIGYWKTATADLHNKLQEINDVLDGVVAETDYPWIGAANIHVPITAIYMKVFHSIVRRSVLGSDAIWYVETDVDSLEEYVSKVDDAINYLAVNKWNIHEALSDVFWTTPKDGLGIMQVPYVEEYETVNDIVFIESDDDFMREFPAPDTSGLSQKEWQQTRQYVQQKASPQNPIEVPVKYERKVYSGPKGEIVELADFCLFPATAVSIDRQYARGYGKRFYLRKGEIRRKRDNGFWYEKETTEYLKGNRGGSKATEYKLSKERNEGITRTGKSDDHEFFEIVYHMVLKAGEDETKLLLTYSYDDDTLVAAYDYPYRVDFYALFRIERKTNRLIGSSVVGQLLDMNAEIDTQHNQRIHSREISTVPSFKGKKSAKKDYDANAEENQFHPGVTFWLDDPDAFDQFKIQPTDLGESMQEEKNDLQICSLTIGADAFLFSGNPQSNDPNAPGNKTIALINQSNLRMDDPINELREGVNKVGEICLSHMYQFYDTDIEYLSIDSNSARSKSSIPKRILRQGIKIKMRGVTVAMNPDAEFQKGMQNFQMLMQVPEIKDRPESRVELARIAMRNGRIEGREKILPPLAQIQQEQAAKQAEAMKQAQQQQAQEQAALDAKTQKDKATALASSMKAKSIDSELKRKELQDAALRNVMVPPAAGTGGGNGVGV